MTPLVKVTFSVNPLSKIAEEEINKLSASKVRKLRKKMLLIPATEAIDEQEKLVLVVESKKVSKKLKVKAQTSEKKIVIVESDEDD